MGQKINPTGLRIGSPPHPAFCSLVFFVKKQSKTNKTNKKQQKSIDFGISIIYNNHIIRLNGIIMKKIRKEKRKHGTLYLQ